MINYSSTQKGQTETQTRGKPADTQIYLEATYLQDPGLEAHLVKFDYLVSYLDRGSNITRLKSASNCSMSFCCLSRHKLEAVINNARIADTCIQLNGKLKTAFNCSKSSYCVSSRRREGAVTNTTISDICLWLSLKLSPTAVYALILFRFKRS